MFLEDTSISALIRPFPRHLLYLSFLDLFTHCFLPTTAFLNVRTFTHSHSVSASFHPHPAPQVLASFPRHLPSISSLLVFFSLLLPTQFSFQISESLFNHLSLHLLIVSTIYILHSCIFSSYPTRPYTSIVSRLPTPIILSGYFSAPISLAPPLL